MFSLKKVILLPLSAVFLASCSLNYGSEVDSESLVPEFTFEEAVFKRYSANALKIDLEAEKLEQYKTDGASYAKNARFKTFKDDGTQDTDGTCALMALKSREKQYSLFDEIKISIKSEELSITAQALFFDANTEQLTGAFDQVVSIERKGTALSGRGFSASGVSKKFSFLSDVTGTVDNKEDENSEDRSSQDFDDIDAIRDGEND